MYTRRRHRRDAMQNARTVKAAVSRRRPTGYHHAAHACQASLTDKHLNPKPEGRCYCAATMASNLLGGFSDSLLQLRHKSMSEVGGGTDVGWLGVPRSRLSSPSYNSLVWVEVRGVNVSKWGVKDDDEHFVLTLHWNKTSYELRWGSRREWAWRSTTRMALQPLCF